MKKLLLLSLLYAVACSGKLPEQEVQRIFSRHSYQEYSPDKIAEALKGGPAGLAKLDPRAAVLNEKKPLKARASDKNYSSGLLFGGQEGHIKLLKVFNGSPAAAAGFTAGDEVLGINGKMPSPGGIEAAIDHSTGFILKAARPGAQLPLEAEVSRDRTFFPQVFSFYDAASRVCFVRLGLFYEGSADAALKAVGAAAALGARGVIFDLRDNPGGVPAEAAAVLKPFARKAGPVFEVRSRHPGYSSVFRAESEGKFAGLKAVVLVNNDTSMVAEIFAAALKDIDGAEVVGQRTSSSVSLTRAFSLGDGRGLEITVARMFPPSGPDLEGVGVAPDVKAGGSGRVWDNSREDTLLRDEAYARAVKLFNAASGGGEAGRL